VKLLYSCISICPEHPFGLGLTSKFIGRSPLILGHSPFLCAFGRFFIAGRSSFNYPVIRNSASWLRSKMKKEEKTTMSTQQNTHHIKKGSYKVLAMLIGMIIGAAMDNIPVGIILGLSFGLALDKHYA
jgi:hypothetical protein